MASGDCIAVMNETHMMTCQGQRHSTSFVTYVVKLELAELSSSEHKLILTVM